MADKDDEDKAPSLRARFAKDVSLQGAAAVIGGIGAHVAGGPAGAGAGIAAGAGLPLIYERLRSHIESRRNRVLEAAAGDLGDDVVAAALDAHPELLPLMVRAVEMAATTDWEAHVDALGAVLRDGIAGDLDTRDASQLLDGIGTITPDGVAILDYLDTHEADHDSQYQDVTLAKHFGWPRGRVRAALRHLEEAGAVDTMGAGMDGEEGWKPLAMAATILGYLRDAG